MTNDLEAYENVTRVFWIKIELRENTQIGNQIHGEIIDAISGEKKPIKDLVDIIIFIIKHLKNMNIQVSWFWRLTSWYRLRNQSKVKSKEKI